MAMTHNVRNLHYLRSTTLDKSARAMPNLLVKQQPQRRLRLLILSAEKEVEFRGVSTYLASQSVNQATQESEEIKVNFDHNTRLRSGWIVSLGLAISLLSPCASFARNSTGSQAAPPDNSAQNKAHDTTSDQQSEATSDRMLTKKIRQAIVADKSLSTYGHNVKIIVQNGSVTLKGPVHSEDEKQTIASKAAEVAGSPDKVSNQLSVKQ
jgi:hyperosmotically inducible protein